MGYSLMMLGDFVEARKHFDDAIARYDPAQHRPLATRFGQTPGCRSCPFGRGYFGFWAIPRRRLRTPTKQPLMLAPSVTPPHRCLRFPKQWLPAGIAVTM